MKRLKKEGVRIVPLNWDVERELDLASGKGFRITEPAIKGTTKLHNGIQSERFGTDFDSEDGYEELYRCPRGCTKGKVYDGSDCPICGGRVEFKDIDLSITGWIILDEHLVIHPIFYNKLAGIIGAKAFKEMITFDKIVAKNGDLENKEGTSSPFYGIGIMEFYERFDEIIDYYSIKKKNKYDEIAEIIQHRDKVFTHSIPAYSALLRPMSFQGESLFYGPIDKIYNRIYINVKLLNNIDLLEKRRKKLMKGRRERMDQGHVLSTVQDDLMELWENVFEQIDGKYGHIQGDILGGMLDWSSRDVIIPDPTLKADEIILNYTAFLELYKYELIGLLMRVNQISSTEAINQIALAKIVHNPKILEMMNYLLELDARYIIINRNPTINYGSLLCVKVKAVKDDFADDYTMSMPIQILTVLNADFDGDVLNVISLKTAEFAKAYNKIFNPRENLFISRNDGKFNSDMNLIKDQAIGLYVFNNIE